MNRPDDDSLTEAERDDVEWVDDLGRRAGAAIRTPAPVTGLDGLRRRQRNRTTTRAVGGGVVAIALVVGIFVVTLRQSNEDNHPVVSDSTPTTTPSSSSSSAPTTSEAPTVAGDDLSALVVRPTRTIAAPIEGEAHRFGFLAGGTQIVGDVGREALAVIDLETGAELRRFETGTFSGIIGFPLAVSPDGRRVTDGDKLWDLQTGEQVGVVTKGGSRASSVLFSPDGALLAVELRCDLRPGGQCLRVFDARSGEQIFETSVGWAFYDVGFRIDDSLTFGASEVGFDPNNPEQFSRSWTAVDLSTGTTSPAIDPGPSHVTSADGTYGLIATGEGDDPLLTKVRVVELGSMAVVSELRLPPELGFLDDEAEFSPDGEIVVAPLFDAGLKSVGVGLWSVATGRLIATLGHLRAPSEAAPRYPDPAARLEVHFSPDDTRVVTRAGDGTIRIWPRPDV